MAKSLKTAKTNPAKDESDKSSQLKKTTNYPDWIFILIFAIATTIFFWNHLAGDAYFWDDFVEQVYPTQSYSAMVAKTGEIPFWNPYQFAGMPFYEDLQVGFYYPFNRALTLFVDDNGYLSPKALQFIIILHYLIAQIGMFYLARSFGSSKLGSSISALSFGLSFALVLHAFHPMIVYQLSWFPLVIMFFRKGILEQNFMNASVSGLILGISILAGHAQTMLYQFLFLGIIFLWYIIGQIINKQPKLYLNIATSVLSVGLAFGIFCVQYLPSSQLAENSARKGYTIEEAAEGSLQFKQLATAMVPKIFGEVSPEQNSPNQWHLEKTPYYYYWDTAFYFGIIAFILALFIILKDFKNREVALFLTLSIFSILYAMGENGVIFSIFHGLPFFDLLRIPSRMLFFFVIGFSVLASFGFDRLIKETKISKIILIWFALILIIPLGTVTGIIPSLISTPDQYNSEVSSEGLSAMIFSILAVSALFMMIKKVINPFPAFMIIIILSFIELYLAGSSFNQGKNNPLDIYRMDPQMEGMLRPNNNDLFRVSMRTYQPSFMAMPRNQGVMSKIQLLEGYNQLQLARIVPPLGDRDKIHNMFNVKYDISITNGRPSWNQRSTRMPRAWLVSNYELIPEDKVKDYMLSSNINYQDTVILEQSPSTRLSGKPIYDIKFETYNQNDYSMLVNSDKAGILVMSEIYYPNWKAYINGTEVKVFRANYCLRAIEVPQGKSKVEFKYESSAYTYGLVISLTSLFAGLGIVIIGLMRRRK